MRQDLGRGRSDIEAQKERDPTRVARTERFGEHPQRHEGGDFLDPRNEGFRGRAMRPSPRDRHTELGLPARHISGPVPMHGRDPGVFPHQDIEEPMYHNVPPGLHPSRVDRFHARIERPRAPRVGPAHPAQADIPMDSPRLSPHAVRNDAPLPPRLDRGFEAHGGYPRDQRPPNSMHHGIDMSQHPHERRLSPQENEFIGPNRNFMPPGPQRHEPSHSRDSHPRGRQQEPQFQDRTSTTWERGVEVPTPPHEQARYDARRQDNGPRKGRRGSGPDIEYTGPQHSPEDGPASYEDERQGPRQQRYGRPISPDVKRTYPPEEWPPRQVVASPPSRTPIRMEMEVDPEPSPPIRAEPLPGWAGFRRRDRGEPPHERRNWGPNSWPGAPEGEQDQSNVESDEESRKRRRIDSGTEVTSTFSRNEQDLRECDRRSFSY
jgi:hypothetical protein